MIEGPRLVTMSFSDQQIPYFYRQGALVPNNPATVMNVTEHPSQLILNIVSGENGKASIYEDAGDNADYASNYAETSISQTFDGRMGEYIISPRKGTVLGIPADRSYKLLIFNTTTPVSAKVDGMKATFSYNKESKCTAIEVPSASCTKERRIQVEYSTSTGITDVKTGQNKITYDSASKKFTASFDSQKKQVSWLVSNMAGKLMLANSYSQVSSFSEDISMLMPQVYISKVVADDKTFISKFMKE